MKIDPRRVYAAMIPPVFVVVGWYLSGVPFERGGDAVSWYAITVAASGWAAAFPFKDRSND